LKEILFHGLYNTWKTLSLLYWPSTVNALCHDAAYDSCGPSSCAPHTDQHPLGKPANQAKCWLSFWLCYKKGGFLANGTNHSMGISIISVGSLLLSALTFPVSRHSLTLQFRAELHFEHENVADWSQFCCKPMLNFILICSLRIFLMVLGGEWQYCGNVE